MKTQHNAHILGALVCTSAFFTGASLMPSLTGTSPVRGQRSALAGRYRGGISTDCLHHSSPLVPVNGCNPLPVSMVLRGGSTGAVSSSLSAAASVAEEVETRTKTASNSKVKAQAPPRSSNYPEVNNRGSGGDDDEEDEDVDGDYSNLDAQRLKTGGGGGDGGTGDQPTRPGTPTSPSSSTEERDTVTIALGKYKVDPFQAKSFSSQYLYALQKLQSDSDDVFGAAFLSLRSNSGIETTRTWKLGIPRATRLLSLHRFKLWWMKPMHSLLPSEVPPETQMILTALPKDPKTGKQMYSLFVPLIDGAVKCSLRGTAEQHLNLVGETGCAKTNVPTKDVAGLFVAVHDDPFELLTKSFKLINNRLSKQVKGSPFSGLIRDAERELTKWRKQEVIKTAVDHSAPDFTNYLGWCTWDSFYTSVDHNKVFNGLDSLRKGGINPKWLILDDGWQSTSNPDAPNGEQWMDHLTSLTANKKFRNADEGTDLAKTVKRAKAEYGIDYFMVWHAIAGYWAGVDYDSPDLLKYKPARASLKAPAGIVEIDPDMKMFFRICRFMNKRFGVVPPEHIRAFYDDYHRYLKEQGVDGVKVDAQSVVNFVGNGHGGSVSLTRAFHNALSSSVRKYFGDSDGAPGEGGRIIHCMCHDSEILLQLPGCYTRRPIIRGSDDFYPRDPAAHGPHLYSNAFNGLLLSQCGLQDWDMFQSNIGPVSWMHAASRAISGGPVYISDRPGEHDVELMSRLVLDDGSVPRPVQNALPTLSSLFSDPQQPGGGLLSVWTENKVPGHGVVGMFNICGSCWNQRKRAYTFIPNGYNGNNNAYNGNNNGYTGNSKTGYTASNLHEESLRASAIAGSVSPEDCYSLYKEATKKVKKESEVLHQRQQQGRGAAGGEGVSDQNQAQLEEELQMKLKSELKFATYLFRSGHLTIGGLEDSQPVALGSQQFELATIATVHTVHVEDVPPRLRQRSGGSVGVSGGVVNSDGMKEVEWASIGLTHLFNAGGVIDSETIINPYEEEDGGNGGNGRVELEIRGKGIFTAYCSEPPAQVTLDGAHVGFNHWRNKAGVGHLYVDLPGPYEGKARKLQVNWDWAEAAERQSRAGPTIPMPPPPVLPPSPPSPPSSSSPSPAQG